MHGGIELAIPGVFLPQVMSETPYGGHDSDRNKSRVGGDLIVILILGLTVRRP